MFGRPEERCIYRPKVLRWGDTILHVGDVFFAVADKLPTGVAFYTDGKEVVLKDFYVFNGILQVNGTRYIVATKMIKEANCFRKIGSMQTMLQSWYTATKVGGLPATVRMETPVSVVDADRMRQTA